MLTERRSRRVRWLPPGNRFVEPPKLRLTGEAPFVRDGVPFPQGGPSNKDARASGANGHAAVGRRLQVENGTRAVSCELESACVRELEHTSCSRVSESL